MFCLDRDSSTEFLPARFESKSPFSNRQDASSGAVRFPDRGTRSLDTLRNYIKTVRCVTDAQTATLLIDPTALPACAPLLLSTGDPQPIPGLESEEAALELIARLVRTGREAPMPAANEAVRYYRGFADGTHFFRIAVSEVASGSTQPSHPSLPVERRRHTREEMVGQPERAVWIGLRYDNGEKHRFFGQLQGDRQRSRNNGRPPTPEWFTQLLVSGAAMAAQVYELSALIQDSITGLTRRSELQARLKQTLVAASEGHGSFALALINPDEFEQVNQRVGRTEGDLVLREIGSLLQQSVRQPEGVYHYGGAVFAVHFSLASEAETSQAAERLRTLLGNHVFLEGAIGLDFSVGAVFYGAHTGEEAQVDSAEMLRRADSALNAAKASGGAGTMIWKPEGFSNTSGNSDRLSGIFTADTRKDYRNMLLLWDTVQVISARSGTAEIANEFVDRVNRTFKPNQTALVSVGNEGCPSLLSATPGMVTPPLAETSKDVAVLLSGDQRRLLARAQQKKETQSARVVAPGGGNRARQPLTAYAVPFPGNEKSTRCLYVDGPADSFHLDSADLVFLSVLSKQVAVALDRSELVLRLKREKERESQRLRAEVRELRQALRHSKLVYQSPRIEALLEVVRKVAPTDATVLITGESGTGKEMIARFLHDQSQRRMKDSFVTLDCGAIAPSLIETELFGHAKGAYTGANGSSKGRILQAEGGTLFLDEIGELPLDVQAKLLRFVQEREITPVGATRSRKIDARIVAATNRDLAEEVEAGRFRRDLYYRLRVVSVTVPPLRERPEDILPLAQYFLETFSAQYEKPERCLSPEAQSALREHLWSGNVRELQNQILQAVIMSGHKELNPSDLRLEPERGDAQRMQAPMYSEPVDNQGILSTLTCSEMPQTDVQSSRDLFQHGPHSDCEPWEALRRALAIQVEEAIRLDKRAGAPLGDWLTEDLVLFAHEAYGRVARKAAGALGMAETTFRRQLEKIARLGRAFALSRSPRWISIKPLIQNLVNSVGPKQDENLVLRARNLLLVEVIVRVPENDSLGSVLMGVTPPTYKRWKAELSSCT